MEIDFNLENIGSWLATFKSWLEYELFSIGAFSLNIYQIVSAVMVMILAAIAARLATRALTRVIGIRSNARDSEIYTITRLASYTIYVIGAFLALSTLGVTFDKMALVAGALSVGIGFGLQNIVNNFISGIIILFEKALRVGDFVELENGVLGEVQEIKIRSTWIRTLGTEDILVPNSQFISNQVTNWTLTDDFKRMSVEFGVAYGTDPRLVMEKVAEAASVHPDVVKEEDKMPGVIFTEFGESSLNFKLVVWIRGDLVKKPGLAVSNFLLLVHGVLKENGIEVPFPQRDLHIRSGLEPWKPGAEKPGMGGEPLEGTARSNKEVGQKAQNR